MGLLVIALAGVAVAFGTTLWFPGTIFLPVILLVESFIVGGILHLLVTLAFQGEGDFLTF